MTGDDGPKGAYNRTPIFKSENYTYCKANMYVHLLLVKKNIWCAVTDEPYIPKDSYDVVKHPKDWMDDDTKKGSYDLKEGTYLSPL